MNLANKITLSRVVLSIVIMIVLLFPFESLNIDLPSFVVGGKVFVEVKYIVAGVLFIIASITDFFDGYVARKYNIVTDFGKMVDAISDKMLTNSLLVILSSAGMISTVVAVIIIVRDFAVDSMKMIVGNKGHAVAAIFTSIAFIFSLSIPIHNNSSVRTSPIILNIKNSTSILILPLFLLTSNTHFTLAI